MILHTSCGQPLHRTSLLQGSACLWCSSWVKHPQGSHKSPKSVEWATPPTQKGKHPLYGLLGLAHYVTCITLLTLKYPQGEDASFPISETEAVVERG